MALRSKCLSRRVSTAGNIYLTAPYNHISLIPVSNKLLNMDILTFFAAICVAVFVIGVSVLITTPFLGTLVRYRANYNPRGLRLDADGNPEVHTGPIVNSYFGMLMRVKRLEV